MVERLMEPKELDAMLTSIECHVYGQNLAASKPYDINSVRARIDFLSGMMRQVLDEHVRHHPDTLHRAMLSLTKIDRRMDALRGELDVHLVNRNPSDVAESMRQVSLEYLAQFVARIPDITWTIAEVDSAIADFIAPDPVPWGELANVAAALRHHVVFELIRARRRLLHTPAARELRQRHDHEATGGLLGVGLSADLAGAVIRAIRCGEIPHVLISD